MKRLLLDSSCTVLERSLLSSVDLDVPPLGALEKVRIMVGREEATALVPAVSARRGTWRVPGVAAIACALAMAAGVALMVGGKYDRTEAARKEPTPPVEYAPVAPPPAETVLEPAQAAPAPPPWATVSARPQPPARTDRQAIPDDRGGCAVPFWHDAKGVKHFKPECMQPSNGTSAPAAAFDKGAAAGALGRVDLSECKAIEGPDGAGHVTVTFANDGTVQSAAVDQGPYPGTPRGGCIAGKFRQAKVPPFDGSPVRVGKSFVLQ